MCFYIKYILFFLLFFFLHYIEYLPPIGDISIAQLWKIPLLVFLLGYNLMNIYGKNGFEYVSYTLAAEKMISPEILVNPFTNLVQVSRQLPFVLFYGFFDRRYADRSRTLEVILYSLAQYVCLASIPTLFGIIKPPKTIELAEVLGIDSYYYSGIFGDVHAASSYFCIATLVLLYGFKLNHFTSRVSKWFNLFLIFIGVLSVYYAYVRTGWMMLVLGILIIYKPERMTYRQLAVSLFVLLLLVLGFFYLYNYNDAFYDRIVGTDAAVGGGSGSIDMTGSGRTDFWLNGLSVWSQNNSLYEFLFGSGVTKVLENNYRTTGMRVFSHNQFVDTLAQNGLVGFLLLLGFYLSLYRFIRKYASYSPYGRLCLSLFICSVVFAFFQSEIYFIYMLIFSVALALMRHTTSGYLK